MRFEGVSHASGRRKTAPIRKSTASGPEAREPGGKARPEANAINMNDESTTNEDQRHGFVKRRER
jgi:hypothetical protein